MAGSDQKACEGETSRVFTKQAAELHRSDHRSLSLGGHGPCHVVSEPWRPGKGSWDPFLLDQTSSAQQEYFMGRAEAVSQGFQRVL